MKIRRKTPLTGRQRIRSAADSGKPAAFSYYANRDEQAVSGRQIQREQRKQRRTDLLRFWLQRSGLVILTIALLASVANALSLTSAAKVLPLKNGAKNLFLHDQTEYEAKAQELLSASPWNRNKVTIDTAKVSRQMKGAFPELTSVSVSLPLLAHRPVIYIETAEPALLLTTIGGTYLVDSTGKALLTGGDIDRVASRELPVVADQSNLQVRLNTPAVSSQQIAFIETIAAQLKARKVKIASMTLPPSANELYVQIADKPYFVKFNMQNADTARQQAGTFLATITQLEKQGATPSKYVDVRVAGRAYYQ